MGAGGGRRATWETRGEVYGGRAQWTALGYRPPLPGLRYPLPHFPAAVDTRLLLPEPGTPSVKGDGRLDFFGLRRHYGMTVAPGTQPELT